MRHLSALAGTDPFFQEPCRTHVHKHISGASGRQGGPLELGSDGPVPWVLAAGT